MRPSARQRLAGFVRLVHPFPSLLDGAVVVAASLLAGGGVSRAALLGAAMTALQFGIGATNDVVDAPRDAGRKPGKPIPAGVVPAAAARGVAVTAFVAGLGLAAAAGSAILVLAAVVVGIGLAYDLRLKGTAWSWLPFAVGIPILPVFGWLGGAGAVPPLFALLIPVAVAAGASLAIANSLVDVERDRAAGVGSIAAALGVERAWAIGAGLVGLVAALATISAWLGRGVLPGVAIAGLAIVPLAGVLVSRGGGAVRRERGWRVQAIGLALLAVGWLLAVAR